jgi:hypothetical protein
VDAVEIDPLSKSKSHCLQVITDAKAYRFAAADEDVLVKALGAMKSAIVKAKAHTAIVTTQAPDHRPDVVSPP